METLTQTRTDRNHGALQRASAWPIPANARTGQTTANERLVRVVAWLPGLFVWSVWAAFTIASLYFVRHYGINIPFWDEWDEIVPVLAGEQSANFAWLWSQHNEHRVLLPRLIFIVLLKLTDNDFRSGMFFSVTALAVLAAAMMIVARHLRGRWSLTDALVPMVLLHWGHSENFVSGYQVAFVLPAVLAGIILLAIVKCRASLSLGGIVLVGSCLVLLPECCACGLVLVPALAAWLAWIGVRQWYVARSAELTPLFFTGAALLASALYFVGYQWPAHSQPGHSLADIGQTALEFGTMSFGPGVVDHWYWCSPTLSGMLVATVVLLTTVACRQPLERARAAGLLTYLTAFVCLALAVGLGRDSGFGLRYAILAAPFLCSIYFAWFLYGGRVVSRLVPLALLLLASFFQWGNFDKGLEFADSHRQALSSFKHSLQSGMSPTELAEHYTGRIYPVKRPLLEYPTKLRRAGIGPFRNVPEE